MFMRSLFGSQNLIRIITHQARSFSHQVVHNQVLKYFCRAKLIDSIRLSLRSGSPDSILPILNNPHLDSFVVSNALRSAPSPESALSFVESLKRVPHFVHTQQTLQAIAKVLAKSGRVAQLKKLLNAINDGKFPKVRPISFMESMRLYATAGDLESVLRVWDEFRSQGKKPCIESYNIIMDLYVQMGKDLEAVQTLRNLMQGGNIPNSRTFTIVIEHLVDTGNVDRAKDVFYVLPLMRVKHTTRQYLVLVEAFLNLKRYDVVESLLREMKTEGILPPRSLCNLLKCAVETGFLEGIDEFVEEMEPDDRIKKIELLENQKIDENEEDADEFISDAGIDPVKLKPWLDPSALASALRDWKADDVSALEDAKIVWTGRLVCKMIRHFKLPQTAWLFFCWVTDQPGFVHDIHTYSGLITKLSSHGMVDLVDDILLKVKNEEIKLPFNTVRQVIDFYGLSRNGDAALRVFHDVEGLCGSISEHDMASVYSSLLRTLLKCGRDQESMHFVEQMFSKGIHPDSQTFSGLMHHFAAKGDLRTVQNLFNLFRQSGVQSDAYVYKTLIHTYCKCGKATLALRFFEDMRNSGLMPDGATKSLLVKCLWKEGRLKEASVVQGGCKETNDILPLPSSSQLFNINSADLVKIQRLYCDSFQDIAVQDQHS
ncbi:pentatricopeptide repeat-containing protein At5g66631 [Silene latifolia]|uniref:pentatricopeptide repeat-containing protein At5g66631 n=1 Tax=Silene latifolia TaxID=37657 RepID=UPI003D78A43D